MESLSKDGPTRVRGREVTLGSRPWDLCLAGRNPN